MCDINTCVAASDWHLKLLRVGVCDINTCAAASDWHLKLLRVGVSRAEIAHVAGD